MQADPEIGPFHLGMEHPRGEKVRVAKAALLRCEHHGDHPRRGSQVIGEPSSSIFPRESLSFRGKNGSRRGDGFWQTG